jgi:hypothetical protein
MANSYPKWNLQNKPRDESLLKVRDKTPKARFKAMVVMGKRA